MASMQPVEPNNQTKPEYDANGTHLLSGMTDAAAIGDLRTYASGHDATCAAIRSPRVFCTCGRAAIGQALRAIERSQADQTGATRGNNEQ